MAKKREGSKDNPKSLPMPVNKNKREGGTEKPTFGRDAKKKTSPPKRKKK